MYNTVFSYMMTYLISQTICMKILYGYIMHSLFSVPTRIEINEENRFLQYRNKLRLKFIFSVGIFG